VVGEGDADLAARVERIRRGDLAPLAAHLLVDARPALDHLAAAHREEEIAGGVHPDGVHVVEGDADLLRMRALGPGGLAVDPGCREAGFQFKLKT
jgi:hypothetical protein